MRGWRSPRLAWLALLVHLLPLPAHAQQLARAGVVTTLEGSVTAVRSVAPRPVPLKFRDDVFLRDRVVTEERSFARLLLGGKAVVSVRERSSLTITETPGQSVVDLESGKIALTVARERMRPGEVIQIKTPNAIAGVRGTVVVAEVRYRMSGGAQQPLSSFHVLRGKVDVIHLDPANQAPLGLPVTVDAGEKVEVDNTAPPAKGTFTVAEVAAIVAGLQPSQTPAAGPATQQQIRADAMATAGALLAALVGPAPGESPPPSGTAGQTEEAAKAITEPPQPPRAPLSLNPPQDTTGLIDPLNTGGTDTIVSGSPPQGPLPGPPPGPPPGAEPPPDPEPPPPASQLVISGLEVELPPGQSLVSFAGTQTFTFGDPFAQVLASTVTQLGPDHLLQVVPGATLSLAGPLLSVEDSTLVAGADLLHIAGSVTGIGSQPFLAVDPSSIMAPGDLVAIAGGSLHLAAPLLTDAGGTFGIGGSVLAISGGGALASQATAPLFQLADSTLQSGTFLSVLGDGSSATLAGPLLSAQGGALSVAGLALVDVSLGGLLSSTGTAPLVDLAGTAVSLPETTFVGSGGTVNLGGGLFRGHDLPGELDLTVFVDHGGTLTAVGPLVDVAASEVGLQIMLGDGSALTVSGGPLVRVTDGVLLTGALVSSDGTGNAFQVSGSLLEAAGGAVAIVNRLLEAGGGDAIALALPAGVPVVRLEGSTLIGTSDENPLVRFGTTSGAPVAQTGRALVATAQGGTPSAIALAAPLLALDSVILPDAGPQVSLASSGVNFAGETSLIAVRGQASVAGGLLGLTDAAITGDADLLPALVRIEGSLVVGTGPVIAVGGDGSEITGFGTLLAIESDGALGAARPALALSGGTVEAGTVVASAGILTMAGGQALLDVNGGSLTAAASLAELSGPTTLGGPLLALTGGVVTANEDALAVGVTEVLSSPAPVFDVAGGHLRTLDGAHLVSLAGGSLVLGGPLLRTTGAGALVEVTGDALHVASSVTGPAGAPLFQATAGTVAVDGDLVDLAEGSELHLGGSVASVTGGSLTANRGLAIDAPVAVTAGAPLFSVTAGQLATTGSLIDLAADLTLAGAGLFLSGGAVTIGGTAVRLVAGVLETGGPAALFELTGGTLEVEGGENHLLAITGGGASLGRPVLRLSSSSSAAIGGHVIAVAPGAALTGPTNGTPLIEVNDGTALTAGGAMARLGAGATVGVTSPFLHVGGGTASSALVLDVDTSLSMTTGGAAIRVAGGELTATDALARLAGPISLTVPVLSQTGGSIDAGTGLRVSNALTAEGSIALVHVSGGSLTTTANLVDVADATVSLGGFAQVLRLISGAPDVNVGGDVLRLTAAGVTSTAEGALLDLLTGSLTAGGSLIALGAGSELDLVFAPILLRGSTVRAAHAFTVEAPLALPPGWPMVDIRDGALETTGDLLVLLPGASLEVHGGAVLQRGGSITGAGHGLAVGAAPITTIGSQALFEIDAGSLAITGAGHDLVRAGGGVLTLARPVLRVLPGTATVAVAGDVLALGPGSTLHGPPGIPLVTVEGGESVVVGGDAVDLGAGTTVTLDGPALRVMAGSLSTGRGVVSATPLALPLALVDVRGGLLSTAGPLVEASALLSTQTASLLQQVGGVITVQGPAFVLGGGLDFTGSIAAVAFVDGQFQTTGPGAHLVSLPSGPATFDQFASAVRILPADDADSPAITVGGDVLGVSGGTLTTAPGNALLDLRSGTLSAAGDLIEIGPGASLVARSTLVRVADSPAQPGAGAGVSAATVLHLLSPVTTPAAAAIALDAGSLATTGDLALIAADLTLGGALLSQTGGSVTVGGSVVRLVGGSALTTDGSPLVRLAGGSLAAASLLGGDGAGNLVDFTGTVLDVADADVTLGRVTDEVDGGTDQIRLTLGAGEPAVRLARAALALQGGSLVTLGVDGSPTCSPCPPVPTTPGVALVATGAPGDPSRITLHEALLEVLDVNPVGGAALVQLANTIVEQDGDGAPLLSMLTSAPRGGAHHLLSAVDSEIDTSGAVFRFGAGRMTSDAAGAYLDLAGTRVAARRLVDLNGSLDLNGPLVAVSGGEIAADSALRALGDDAQVAMASVSPVVGILGGDHRFDRMFDLTGAGRADETIGGFGSLPDVTLSLGTHAPLRGAPGPLLAPVLTVSGGTLDTGPVLFLDTVRIDTAAPLVHATGSLISAAGPLVHMLRHARVDAEVPGGALLRFLGGTLDVVDGGFGLASGALVRVGSPFVPAGSGSLLRTGSESVTTHLLTIGPGTTLVLGSGPLLAVINGSTAQIFGSLLVFTGTGSTVTVENDLCLAYICADFSGVRVARGQDVPLEAIQIAGTPILGLDGNALVLGADDALVLVDGAGSRLLIGAPGTSGGPEIEIVGITRTLGPGETLKTYAGTSTSPGPSPVIRIVEALVQGPASALVRVPAGANVTLGSGPLMTIVDSEVDASRLLDVQGVLTSLGTLPLIDVDPSTITAGTLVAVDGGTVTTAGPLFGDVNGTLTAGGPAFAVVNGGHVSGGSPALIALSGTGLHVQTGDVLQASGAGTTVEADSVLLDISAASEIVAPGAAVRVAASAQVTAADALIRASGSTLALGGAVAAAGGALSLGSSAVDLASTTLFAAGPVIALSGGAALATSTADPAVRIADGVLTAPALLGFDGIDSTAHIRSTLLEVGSGGAALLGRLVESPGSDNTLTLALGPGVPLVRVTNGLVTMAEGALLALTGQAAPGGFAGTAVVASDAVLNLGEALVRFDSEVSAIGLSALAQLAGTSVFLPRPGAVFDVASTADVTRPLLTALDGVVDLRNPDFNALLGSVGVGAGPQGLAFSPGGGLAYVASPDADTVSVIDVASGTALAAVAVGDAPRAVAVTPDGARAYVTLEGQDSVAVIAAATNAVIADIAVGDGPTDLALRPDGARLYVANRAEGTVSVIDTASHATLATIPVGAGADALAVAPDGTRLFVGSSTGVVSVVDTATSTVTGTIQIAGVPAGLAVDPAGRRLYVTEQGGALSVIETATGFAVTRIAIPGGAAGVAVSGDGARVYVAGVAAGRITIVDTFSMTVMGTVAVGTGPEGVAISPDGAVALVANTGAASVSVIDVRPGGRLLDVAAGASLESTTAEPLLAFTGASVTGGDGLLRIAGTPPPGRASLALRGPLLDAIDTAFTVPNRLPFLEIAGHAAVETAETAAALLRLTGTQPARTPVLGTGPFILLRALDDGQIGPVVTLSGGLLEVDHVALTVGDGDTYVASLLLVRDGAVVSTTGTFPLLAITDADVDVAGPIVNARRSVSLDAPTTISLGGPLVIAEQSTLRTSTLGYDARFGTTDVPCCPGFSIIQGARLTATTTDPLIRLASSTFAAGPDARSGSHFFNVADASPGRSPSELLAPALVRLAGPLLRATDSTITALLSLLRVARSTLESTSGDALLQLIGDHDITAVALGGTNPLTNAIASGRLLDLTGAAQGAPGDRDFIPAAPALVSLAGPLLEAARATITTTSDVVGVNAGAVLESTTALPLLLLHDTALTAGHAGNDANLLEVARQGPGGDAAVDLGGPLARITGTSALTLHGGLVSVFEGGRLTVSGSDEALVSIAGGTHMLAINDNNATFSVTGGGPSGTNLPALLDLSGPLFSASDASIAFADPATNVNPFVFVGDGSELRSASALPLIALDGVALDGASLVIARRSRVASEPTRVAVAGPLVRAVDSTLVMSSAAFGSVPGTVPGPCCSVVFFGQGARLEATGSDPLIQIVRSALDVRDPVRSGSNVFSLNDFLSTAELVAPATATLAGPLLAAQGSTVEVLGHLAVIVRSHLSSSAIAPLIDLEPFDAVRTTISLGGPNPFGTPVNATTDARLLLVSGGASGAIPAADATVMVAGPLLRATGSDIDATGGIVGVYNGALLTSTTGSPLLQLDDATVETGAPGAVPAPIFGEIVDVGGLGGDGGGARARLELTAPGGGLLAATSGSRIAATGTVLSLFTGGVLTSATATPLIAIEDSELIAGTEAAPTGRRLVGLSGGASTAQLSALTLHGSLIAATDSTLSATGSGIGVFTGAGLTTDGPAPLVSLAGTELTSGLPAYTNDFDGALVHLSGRGGDASDLPAHLVLGGALLAATGGSKITAHGNAIHVSLGAALTGNGPVALVQLDGSVFETRFDLLAVFDSAVSLSGPLLAVTGGGFTAERRLAGIFGSAVTMGGPALPFVALTGGIHEIATAAGGTGILVGTGASLTVPGPLVAITGGAVSLGNPLVQVTLPGAIAAGGPFLLMDGGSLAGTSTSALIGFDVQAGSPTTPGALTLPSSLVALGNGASAVLGGGVLFAKDLALALTAEDAAVVSLLDGAGFQSGSTPLLHLTSNAATLAGSGSVLTVDGHLVGLEISAPGRPRPTMTLGGGVLDASLTRVVAGSRDTDSAPLLAVLDSARLVAASTAPLFVFDRADVVAAGGITTVRRSTVGAGEPSTLEAAGPLLVATGSTFLMSSLGLQDELGSAVDAPCCSAFSVSQGGRLVGTGTAPLVQLADTVFRTGPDEKSGGSIFNVFDTAGVFPAGESTAGASVALAGPLFRATGSTVSSLGNFLGVVRSMFASTATGPLIDLEGGSVAVGGPNPFGGTSLSRIAVLTGASASLSLAGPLLHASGTAIASTEDFVGIFDGAAVASTTTSPLLSIAGGSVTTAAPGSFVAMSSAGGAPVSSLILAGGLLEATDTTLTIGDSGTANTLVIPMFLLLNAGATLERHTATGSTPAPLLALTRTTASVSGQLVDVRAGSAMTIDGALLRAVDSAIDVTSLASSSECCNAFRVGSGSTLTATGAEALVQLVRSTINAGPDAQSGGNVFRVVDDGVAGAALDISGPLLDASDSRITALVDFLQVTRGTVVGQGTAPLVTLSGTADGQDVALSVGGVSAHPASEGTQFFGRLLNLTASASSGQAGLAASVALAGGFLQAFEAPVESVGDTVRVANGAQLSMTGSAPLLDLDTSSLAAGVPGVAAGLLHVTGTGGPDVDPARAVLHGPLLRAAQSVVSVTGDAVRASAGGVVDGQGSEALLQVDGSALSAGLSLLAAIGGGSVSLAGPLLAATGDSSIGVARHLVHAAGGTVAATGSALPLVSLQGGTHEIASAGDFYAFDVEAEPGSSLSVPSALFAVDQAAATMGGGLLRVVAPGALSVGAQLLLMQGGSLTSGSSQPFVNLNPAISGPGETLVLSTPQHFVLLRDGAVLELRGSLLFARQAQLSATGSTASAFSLIDGASLTTIGTDAPLLEFTGTAGGRTTFTATRFLMPLSTLAPGNPSPAVTLSGPLLRATMTDFTHGDAASNTFGMFFVSDGAILTGPRSAGGADGAALLQLVDSTAVTSGGVLGVRRSKSDGAGNFTIRSTVDLQGPLLAAVGSSLTSESTALPGGGRCCAVFSFEEGARLLSSGSAPLIQLTDSAVPSASVFFFASNGGTFGDALDGPVSIELAGGLVRDTRGEYAIRGGFSTFRNGASLTSTKSDPLLQFTDSIVDMDNGSLYSQFSARPTTGTFGPGDPRNVTTVTLRGSLLAASDSVLDSGTGTTFISIRDGATLDTRQAPAGTALIDLAETRVEAGGAFLNVAYLTVDGFGNPLPGSKVAPALHLAGSLLRMSGGTLETASNFLGVFDDGVLTTDSAAAALIDVSGAAGLSAGPHPDTGALGVSQFVLLFGRSLDDIPRAPDMTLAGPLLRVAGGSSVDATGVGIGVYAGARLTAAASEALVSITESVVSFGRFQGVGPAASHQSRLLDVQGVATIAGIARASEVALAGPLLLMTDSTMIVAESLIVLANGGLLSSTGLGALVQLVETGNGDNHLELGVGGLFSSFLYTCSQGAVCSSQAGAGLTLHGPLLSAQDMEPSVDDTPMNVGQRLVLAQGDAALVTTPRDALYPLVTLAGDRIVSGNDAIGGVLFEIRGFESGSTSGAPPLMSDPEVNPVTGAQTGLQFGVQTPVQHGGGGPLLEAQSGAFVNVRGPNGSVVRLDTALLDATAPLIALAGVGTELRTSGTAVDLSGRARLSSTAAEALIKLENQARLDVLNGHLVNVAASRLNVAGDLLRMGSGTIMNINGVLLSLLGGGVVNIGGALVRFTGSNATLSITNNLVPTRFISGIPVHEAGGTLQAAIGPNALVNLNANGNNITINGQVLGQSESFTGSLISVGPGGGTLGVGN